MVDHRPRSHTRQVTPAMHACRFHGGPSLAQAAERIGEERRKLQEVRSLHRPNWNILQPREVCPHSMSRAFMFQAASLIARLSATQLSWREICRAVLDLLIKDDFCTAG